MMLLLVPICGFLFGFAMQRGHIYEPDVIRNQMDFSNQTMLKMFLSAYAFSLLSTAILSIFGIPGIPGKDFLESMRKLIMCRKRGFVSTFVGSFLLGVGMTLTGSCPGTVFPQFGAGVLSSILILLGGIIGATIYGLLDERLSDFVKLGNDWGKSVTLDQLLNINYTLLNLILFTFVTLGLTLLEIFGPSYAPIAFPYGLNSWNPLISGVIIGSLQMILMPAFNRGLGTSSSYVFGSAMLLTPFMDIKNYPYLLSAKSDKGNQSQVMFVVGASTGSLVSSLLSGQFGINNLTTIDYILAFIGGIILVFGARLANGCTSGHGLTGSALQSLNSNLAIVGMFSGGIITKLIWNLIV